MTKELSTKVVLSVVKKLVEKYNLPEGEAFIISTLEVNRVVREEIDKLKR